MNREIVKMKSKILTMILVTFLALIGTVFASPINVENVDVKEIGGSYTVLVSLNNADTQTGVYTELIFEISELGTSKNLGAVKVDVNDTVVLSYALSEVTNNADMLKKGSTYQLIAKTDDDSASTAFLYGNPKDTEGLGLVLDTVEVNNQIVTDIDSLQVLNGETLNVELRMSALENVDDARIMVFIEGYEHSPIVGSTEIFSLKEGKTYIKTVSINLPSDMRSEQDYKLRITGANDLSGLTYKEFTLYIDTERERVDILDLVMTPSSGVEPGQNIIANVRLKNRGQQEQDSVKVTVEIPELRVSESSYVSNLNKNEVATSDDMLIFIPDTASAKVYSAYVKLTYNDGYTQSVEEFTFNVLSPAVVEEENLLVTYPDNIELKAMESKSFDIVVANPNDESKPISIAAVEPAWADVEITPLLVMVQGGTSESLKVTITPKEAIEGDKQMTLLVKEGSVTIKEITVNAYVEPAKDDSQQVNWLNIILAVLLIIAIIILLALVITIARRRNDEDKEITTTEEYY